MGRRRSRRDHRAPYLDSTRGIPPACPFHCHGRRAEGEWTLATFASEIPCAGPCPLEGIPSPSARLYQRETPGAVRIDKTLCMEMVEKVGRAFRTGRFGRGGLPLSGALRLSGVHLRIGHTAA